MLLISASQVLITTKYVQIALKIRLFLRIQEVRPIIIINILENYQFTSDYNILNDKSSSRSLFYKVINQTKYTLPMVRRIMPKKEKENNKSELMFSTITKNSRSRQCPPSKINNGYHKICRFSSIIKF